MSSTEIATSVADTSLDSFSGSGETFWCVNVCECVSDCLSLIHTADEHRDDWLISRYPGNVPSAKTALQCVFLCGSVFKNKGIYLNCQHIYMLCLLALVCVCVLTPLVPMSVRTELWPVMHWACLSGGVTRYPSGPRSPRAVTQSAYQSQAFHTFLSARKHLTHTHTL